MSKSIHNEKSLSHTKKVLGDNTRNPTAACRRTISASRDIECPGLFDRFLIDVNRKYRTGCFSTTVAIYLRRVSPPSLFMKIAIALEIDTTMDPLLWRARPRHLRNCEVSKQFLLGSISKKVILNHSTIVLNFNDRFFAFKEDYCKESFKNVNKKIVKQNTDSFFTFKQILYQNEKLFSENYSLIKINLVLLQTLVFQSKKYRKNKPTRFRFIVDNAILDFLIFAWLQRWAVWYANSIKGA